MSPSPMGKLRNTGWVTLILVLLLYPSQTPPSSRRPASSGPDCQNLFATFCEGEDLQVYTDPTGEVWGERKTLFELQQLRENSHFHSFIDKIYPPHRVLQIRKVEHWVRREILRWIDEKTGSTLDQRDRRELRLKIQSVRLEIPHRSQKPQESQLDSGILLEHGAFYETQNQQGQQLRRIRLGGAYVLGTSSKANWVFTLAHEFAHAIDPCELRASGWTPPALEKLNGCLLEKGVIQTPSDRHECFKRDQLSEVFADWLATEILVAWLERYGQEYPTPHRWALVGNSVRDLCPLPEGDYDSEWHPETRTRINRILGENPKMRIYLGCPPSDQKTCRTDDQ